MSRKYAYSYDREDFVGSYDTPEQAFADAVAGTEGVSSPPTSIYIGTIVDADPQAHDHARQIVDAMSRRAHVDYGESAFNYLRHVSREQVKELDDGIGETILAWLKRHELMPTFVQVRAIREFPVALPSFAPAPRAESPAPAQPVDSLGM